MTWPGRPRTDAALCQKERDGTLASSRLTKEARRLQLLDTAASLIRESGADALTLANVAELAGVSKPVAYEHFQTRSGLLKALYLHLDAQMSVAVEAALRRTARSLEDVARILAAAYVDCLLVSGREYGAIAGALAASREQESFRQGLRDGYLERYGLALRHFVDMDDRRLRPLLIGLLAAAAELSQEAVDGRLGRDTAVETIASLMVGALTPLKIEPAPAGHMHPE